MKWKTVELTEDRIVHRCWYRGTSVERILEPSPTKKWPNGVRRFEVTGYRAFRGRIAPTFNAALSDDYRTTA